MNRWVTDDIAHASFELFDSEVQNETLPIFESPKARAISGR